MSSLKSRKMMHAGADAPAPANLSGGALYARYAMAGALCCGITHSAIVPLDVVKTEMQLFPGKYKSLPSAFGEIVKTRGVGALATGLGPTAAGYLMQGAFKFGFYEFFKKNYADAVGENAAEYRTLIYLASAASAEFFADIALCPMEATRIRLVSQPDFAPGLLSAFPKILKNEGPLAFYKGFTPILFKQIPYTMAKFAVFEKVSEIVYNSMDTPRDQLANSTQLGISLGCGVAAGVVASLVSQPADTVLSVVNKTQSEETALKLIPKTVRELGMKKIWLGTGPRAVMIGALTAGQFFIYDYIKVLCGLPTTKGISKK